MFENRSFVQWEKEGGKCARAMSSNQRNRSQIIKGIARRVSSNRRNVLLVEYMSIDRSRDNAERACVAISSGETI